MHNTVFFSITNDNNKITCPPATKRPKAYITAPWEHKITSFHISIERSGHVSIIMVL